ncbi:MAG TPA: DUF6139 family protein [Ramlibacter sp.]|jgi:hypothetical protein|uniref:DUF6139 family protein n=1 Tax=Ramlibacter sp. TaxID=1917967 RepID=UPI002D687BD2|nr:DUF6139 family protein [Ramlibacter sp.]HZY18387.1 DUF6139 family protein [Ramlibacter sp.]
MQLDIYRRPEPEHKLSYLAVPAGQPIPQEADNVDWRLVATATELDVHQPLTEYGIDDASHQIEEKGYAITSVTHQVEAGD